MRRLLMLIAVAIGFAAAHAAPPGIGVNLSPSNYWTPGQPWIDRIKDSGSWTTQGTLTQALTVDADGMPSNYPAGASMVYAMVGMDSPGQTFDLLWKGDAKFQLPNATVLSTAPGKITFTWDTTRLPTARMQLLIRSGTATDIHIVRDDQLALFQAGEIFQPEWLDLLKGMTHFRVMDWMQTNGSGRTDVLLEAGGSYGVKPVPLSVIVALANKTGMRPWITLPHNITDAGIVAAFDYLQANLKPGIKPIVEFSNEVWNTSFAQNKVAVAAVTAKTGDASYWYGLQVARVAKLARGRPIGVVAMWQFAVPSRFGGVYAGFQAGGGLDTDLEAIGGANYIYGTLNTSTKPDALALLAANDVAGALANVAASLPANLTDHKAWSTLAAAHGWKYWTYEGGQYHLNTNYFGTNAEALRVFYKKVQEDPAAAANLSSELDNFASVNGAAMTIYNLSSPSTTSGYFGIIHAPASWEMYRRRIGEYVAANDNTPSTPLPTLQDLKTQVQAIEAALDRLIAGK